MKIELQYPYCNDWRSGYLREGKGGRKRLDLYNSNTDRTTVAYARYLISCHIGRYLTDKEEVDHIDTDCSNDDISNLQFLSTEEHIEKTTSENTVGRTYVEILCANCGTLFPREARLVHKKNKNYFCSRSCNGKFYWSKGFNNR